MRNLKQIVFSNITKYLTAKCAGQIAKPNICLALSGGVDSMVLLDILQQPQMKLFFNKLTAIHFNHGLRGLAADDDEAFLKKHCANLKIDFYSEKIPVLDLVKNSDKTIEEAARELRYQQLAYLKEYHNLDYIFLAHHADDKAETVFFNIMRGCGLQGLSALREKNVFYLRPMLGISKNEILKYALDNKIMIRDDLTNRENDYSRNKIRNILIPQIESSLKRNIKPALLRLSEIADNANDFIAHQTFQILADTQNILVLPDSIILNKDFFLNQHSYICKELLSITSYKLGCSYHLDYHRAEFIYKKILAGKAFKEKWQELEYALWNNFIYVGKTLQKQDLQLNINYDIKYNFMNSLLILSKTNCVSSQYYFSAESVKGDIRVVNIQNDALFKPFGRNDYIQINKVLTDKKIPSFLRDKLFMLIDDEKVLFISGVGIDNRVRLNKSDSERITVCLKNPILDFVNRNHLPLG